MLILASQSPRRKELLAQLNMPFIVRASDVDETMDPKKRAFDEVARVSRAKAEAINAEPADIVVAADTIVVCDGNILGKPVDEADAYRMLTLLSAKQHQVMTGMSVLHNGKCITCTEVTDITFRALSEKQIQDYIRTKEPMDKAGAYAIQGGASEFVEKITGDYYNVVGLPIGRLSQILEELAPELMEDTK